MAETLVVEAVCEKCGADVRENTAFCYNCGTPVVVEAEPALEEVESAIDDASIGEEPSDDATKSALDDLAERLKLDEEADNKLARAAAERKKARVKQRKSNEFRWESSEDSAGGMVVVVALLVSLVAGIVVFLTVFWR